MTQKTSDQRSLSAHGGENVVPTGGEGVDAKGGDNLGSSFFGHAGNGRRQRLGSRRACPVVLRAPGRWRRLATRGRGSSLCIARPRPQGWGPKRRSRTRRRSRARSTSSPATRATGASPPPFPAVPTRDPPYDQSARIAPTSFRATVAAANSCGSSVPARSPRATCAGGRRWKSGPCVQSEQTRPLDSRRPSTSLT